MLFKLRDKMHVKRVIFKNNNIWDFSFVGPNCSF